MMNSDERYAKFVPLARAVAEEAKKAAMEKLAEAVAGNTSRDLVLVYFSEGLYAAAMEMGIPPELFEDSLRHINSAYGNEVALNSFRVVN